MIDRHHWIGAQTSFDESGAEGVDEDAEKNYEKDIESERGGESGEV
jgi:hypothetical protein